MQRRFYRLLLFCTLLFTGVREMRAQSAAPDSLADAATTVLFKNGASATGTLVSFIPNQTLTLRLMDGRVMTYPASDIERVTAASLAVQNALLPPRRKAQGIFEVFGGASPAQSRAFLAGLRVGAVLPDNAYLGGIISPSVGYSSNFGYIGFEIGSVTVETPVQLKPYVGIGLGFFNVQNFGESICLVPGVTLAAPVENILRIGVDVRYLFIPLNPRYEANPVYLFGCLTLGVQW